jgi:FecR protein
MTLPRKCTAINALVLLVSLLAATCAWAAQVAGTVVNVSGPLLAKKADGTVKVLTQKSTVEEGDTLVTEKDTYARIRFTDNSEVTLRPNSQFKIDSFAFDDDKPQNDNAAFSLVKGGLRAVTGTLGKRNKEKVGFNTPTATIGIRGTIFTAEYIPPDDRAVAAYAFASVAALDSGMAISDAGSGTLLPVGSILPLRVAQAVPPKSPGLAPGLYVHVIDGMIQLTNRGGSQDFAAGQFGYTPSLVQPPIVLPANPGLQFTPPPAFSTSSTQQGRKTAADAASVDCEVR